jgi:2-keto-4-pentenoate hydratase/2-oxohepta-3-ene-1,7-dioic acid hydratase in catechol pathway
VGDLIFTGTPEGVAQVKIGDKLEGYIGNEKFLDLNIK